MLRLFLQDQGNKMNFSKDYLRKLAVKRIPKKKRGKGIGKDGFPTEEGIYLIKDPDFHEETSEIDVYKHPIKGLLFCR